LGTNLDQNWVLKNGLDDGVMGSAGQSDSESTTARGRKRFRSLGGNKKGRNISGKGVSGVSDLKSDKKQEKSSVVKTSSRKNKFLRARSSSSKYDKQMDVKKFLNSPILGMLHLKDFQLKLTNFENARYIDTISKSKNQTYNQTASTSQNMAEANKDTRFTVTTRPFRAPEVILQMAYGK
jgi:hypothetical protein